MKKGETVEEIKLNSLKMDRRHFVAAGAAAVATLGAAGSLYGCDNRLSETSGDASAGTDAPAQPAGEWKTLACLHGCGTRCMNQALVQDGVVIRQKTDDTHEDSIEYPQQRGCLRGRALVEFEMGADRIKYPLKRKSWTPEDPHGDLRGKEGYERISWDEALDIVAEQLRKVYTEHGPRAVFMPCNLSGGRAAVAPLLNALGGYLAVSDSISYGTYTANTEYLGLSFGGECMVNDRMDLIKNAKVIVLAGQNPGWGSNGNPSHFFRAAYDNGAQFIYVGPSYNVSAAMLDARWMPVRPGTDTAFYIGVAGEMLRLEEERGGILDIDFLHRCCIGFDDESMPSDAATTESYAGYLKGEYDGTPKDAAWASAICGVPAEDITWFAETMGKDNDVVLSHGYAAARCNGAEDLPQAYMAIACMGGHIGKPGNGTGNYYVDRQGPGGVQIVSTGGDGTDEVELPELSPLYDPAKVEGVIEDDFVNGLEVWDAIIDGKYQSTGRCWSGVFNKPIERECDIRVVYGGRDGSARSVPNSSKMPEALRKLDFVVIQQYAPSATTPYADIILPDLANIERDQIVGNGDRDREMVLVYSKVSETPFEAKSDQWINEQLLERLGYNPKDVYPFTEEQLFFNQLANTVVNDGNENPTSLVTITEEDIANWGVEGAPQEGLIGLEELRSKGIYQVERSFGDEYDHIAMAAFREDPASDPRPSASGLFEIYCQAKADMYNTAAMAGETYKPYPTYHEVAAEEGYPLLMFNTHYPRTACSDFNNVVTLREACEAPVTLNAADAAERGIAAGDPILVSSPYGTILRTASVSSCIVPGAIDVPNGGWPEIDEDGIDRGGCPNTLYGGAPRGMGVSGYNNVSVQVEKWDGGELAPDFETQLTVCPE